MYCKRSCRQRRAEITTRGKEARAAYAAGVQEGRSVALKENRQAVVAALARFQEFLRVPLENALIAQGRIAGVIERNGDATAAEIRVDLESGIYSLVEMTEKLLAKTREPVSRSGRLVNTDRPRSRASNQG